MTEACLFRTSTKREAWDGFVSFSGELEDGLSSISRLALFFGLSTVVFEGELLLELLFVELVV